MASGPNHLGQPIGPALPSWKAPPFPAKVVMQGRFCRLEPLAPERHARALFDANALDEDQRNWTYLPYGPFADFDEYHAWLVDSAAQKDPVFFAIVEPDKGQAIGVASYLRIDMESGSIEVGHLNYSPLLQQKPAATEAMFLMMKHAFELGYRRYEWKCDSLNAPSCAAALRLGFEFEGIFRQAKVYKGRSRDTAWYSILDSEWPALENAFERWLDPANFSDGRQKSRLSELTAAARKLLVSAVLSVMLVVLAVACSKKQPPELAPKPSASVLAATPSPRPSASVDGNAQNFFAGPALARLAPAEQAHWRRYLEDSEKLRAVDQAALAGELGRAGKKALEKAPYGKGFKVLPEMSGAWFTSETGVKLTDVVLSYQTPSGGWSKRVDYGVGPRQLGQSYFSENTRHDYIATIDNDSTIAQLTFLAGARAVREEPRLAQAFERGFDYLIAAQLPNGCWPQVYPLMGGYHDAATFNDNATVNVLELLGKAARGEPPLPSAERRDRAAAAVKRGIDCIVHSQVVDGGRRTVWGQQHDPVTLAPVAARSYELVGLSGRESAWITEYLMTLPNPDAAVVEAVHAAIEWFRARAIPGLHYEDYTLTKVEDAPPLWARLYELGTNLPIFSNRDGIKRYDWNELTDRRRGYAWYGQEPARAIERYAGWAKKHPRAR